MARRRRVPPGNLPRGRGINPADVAARFTRRKRDPVYRVGQVAHPPQAEPVGSAAPADEDDR